MNLLADEKPTAAFILSLLGGIFILFVGLILSILGAILMGVLGAFYPPSMPILMGYGSLIGILGIFYGTIIIICAVKMHNEPENQTWSILIIIFSVLSLFGAGAGLYIGLILGLIGGILGLTWKPPPQPRQYYPPPKTQPPASPIQHQPFKQERTPIKYCPFCGGKIEPPGEVLHALRNKAGKLTSCKS